MKRNKIYTSKYSTLVIELSNQCPLNCPHCMFNAGPKSTWPRLDCQKAIQIIDSAAELGTVLQVSVGHQEPFVNYEDLLTLARYIHKDYNCPMAISTSCYWALTHAIAETRFKELKDLGVRSVLVSLDDFHLHFVPITKFVNVINACQTLDLEVTVQSIVTVTSRRSEHFRELLKGEVIIDNITWIDNPVTPVGRALQIAPEEVPRKSLSSGGCSVFCVIHVGPDGTVKPCCGAGLVADALTVGNINDSRISELAESMEINPILNSLAVWGGPIHFINILKMCGRQDLMSEKYSGPCHACYELLTNPESLELIKNYLEPKKVNLLAARWYMEKHRGLFKLPKVTKIEKTPRFSDGQ